MSESAEMLLAGRVRERTSPAGWAWLEEQRTKVSAEPGALGIAFPGAGRRVGRDALLAPVPGVPVRLDEDAGPILNPWTLADAARALLLLADAAREPEGAAGRANALYFESSGEERIGVLRSLQLLPPDDAAVPAVLDALRANAADLFAAAIAENLYASAHLPDAAFFQGVLKCAFTGVRMDRVERVEERTTPELVRMLLGYASERDAAGRPVPVELWPLVALHPSPDLAERIVSRLRDARDPYERKVLEVALARAER